MYGTLLLIMEKPIILTHAFLTPALLKSLKMIEFQQQLRKNEKNVTTYLIQKNLKLAVIKRTDYLKINGRWAILLNEVNLPPKSTDGESLDVIKKRYYFGLGTVKPPQLKKVVGYLR